MPTNSKRYLDKITAILGNRPLAADIHRAISAALKQPIIRLTSKKSVWDVLERSLNAAIRDIESHPRGQLFRRLIEHGPLYPDDPESLLKDSTTVLSDAECGECVEFIYSHMVNRFKGELAELLALEPCLELIKELARKKQLPRALGFYWGETVQERRKVPTNKKNEARWGGFTKGADGLLLDCTGARNKGLLAAKIIGVMEVKSMRLPTTKLLDQINSHVERLGGGVKLKDKEWGAESVSIASSKEGLHRFLVMPSSWKVSRAWRDVKTARGSQLVFPEPDCPQERALIRETAKNVWHITLPWSQEALEQAAYEMTFWYMSRVGTHIYSRKKLPSGWEYMTPAEAGYNAIKEKLYYIPLRPISPRHERLAMRLYNVYSFGYPAAVDAKRMLWPGDFTHYMVTQDALEELKKQKLPVGVTQALTSLLNRQITGEHIFMKLLRRRIGTERTREFGPLILKNVKHYPEEWYTPDNQ